MKRTILLILITVILLSPALALNVTTDITQIKMHPDFWAGLLPSYVAYRFNLNLFQLIPERTSEISVTLSTGIIPRTINANPYNGEPMYLWKRDGHQSVNALLTDQSDPTHTYDVIDTTDLIEAPYDTMSGGWSVRVGQGFGESVEPKKDRFNLWLSFDGQWERALNPILQVDRKGYPFVNKLFDYKLSENKKVIPTYQIFGAPDLRGDQQMLSLSLNAGFEFNMLSVKTARVHGFDFKSKFTWAPANLSAFYSGRADYMRFWAYANGGYTIAEGFNPRGNLKWSLVVEDEMEIRVLDGTMVPKFAETSEGKVWGLEPANTTFFGRNSLKLRYFGEVFLNGMCVPSAYLFLDIGYNGGYINNSNPRISDRIWTGSTGVNLDLQLFEVLHIYYEIGYIFLPGNDDTKRGFRIPSMIKFLVKVNF